MHVDHLSNHPGYGVESTTPPSGSTCPPAGRRGPSGSRQRRRGRRCSRRSSSTTACGRPRSTPACAVASCRRSLGRRRPRREPDLRREVLGSVRGADRARSPVEPPHRARCSQSCATTWTSTSSPAPAPRRWSSGASRRARSFADADWQAGDEGRGERPAWSRSPCMSAGTPSPRC